jgi:quinol-cytochrome oxidoreductase complex cytochrome b subunit
MKENMNKEIKVKEENLVSGFFKSIKDSIFRYGKIPVDQEGRSYAVFNNLFLHIHSVRVRKHSLRATYTFGLGLISAFLFIILIITGVMLMFYYVPSTADAYNRVLDLRSSVNYGFVLRNMHKWGAESMVFFVFLHMCRVFFTGAYKKPREFNWIIGVVLLMLTMGLSFTGYLLPWDQLAFWAITVGTSIMGYVPGLGEKLRFFLLGGDTVGQEALIRFYVLHVMVLPGVLLGFLAVHIWRIRKDGGLSNPSDNKDAVATSGKQKKTAEKSEKSKGIVSRVKTYGLMELVKGSKPSVGMSEDDMEFTWPSLLIRELIVFVMVMAVLTIWALFVDAPLEAIANANHPPNPAKAPWYFLGLQELVSYSAFIGGVVIPGLIVGGLMIIPYIDRKSVGIGIWFAKERRIANWLFMTFVIVMGIMIIIGTYFRGPNWDFIFPWDYVPVKH